MIRYRAESGVWVAVHPGVYRLEGAPVTWQQLLLAACLATGGVASHRSAGRIWELDLPTTERVEITVGGTSHRTLAGVRIHHARSLPRTSRDGIPCTTVVRTLLDLAAVLEADDLQAALDSALREGLVTLGYVERRIATQGRKGAGILKDLVAAQRRTGTRPAESRRERQVARMLMAQGLPEPVLQYELVRDGRAVARFDLAWPTWRIAGEFQSYRHHSGRRAWRRDAARANRAAAAGWRIIAITEDDVTDGCRKVVAEIWRASAA
jgi:very-short-patch-repair endonuclease